MARSRKKRKQTPKVERVLPTAERIIKGDIAIAQDNVYRALEPTCLERWNEKGLLGSGKRATERFEALQQLIELAEFASLMASNTSKLSPLAQGGSGDGSDITALDKWRNLLAGCSLGARALLTRICCAPCEPIKVDVIELQAAADDLIDSIERSKKTRTNHESVIDRNLKI